MILSYILFTASGMVLSFGTAFAGTITPLPTPKHLRLGVKLDRFVLPETPTVEATQTFREVFIEGYDDLEVVFAKALEYSRDLAREKHLVGRLRRVLSIPMGAPGPFAKREARRIERIQRHGNALMLALAKESHLVALMMYRFTQFDLWNDEAAWVIVTRLRARPTVNIYETIDTALPRLSRPKQIEIAAALEAAPGDRRLALNVLARANLLESRHLDELLEIAASEYDALKALEFVPEHWLYAENLHFAEIVDAIRDAYLRRDPTTVARVEIARARHPSRFFEALERTSFDWIDRDTWPDFDLPATPGATRASHLRLIVDRSCQNPLTWG